MSTRTVLVRIRGDVSDLNAALLSGGRGVREFTRDLETSNDKATWLAQGLTALVPAVVPIAAQAVPILAGLASQIGFGAAAAGTAIAAFHGMGGALQAFNAYQAEPSAQNLEKLQQAMEKLGPAGRAFVGQLELLEPQLKQLKVLSENGILPGAGADLDALMTQLPRFKNLIAEVSGAAGMNLQDLANNIDDPKWHSFFDFLDREAAPTITEMGKTIGHLASGWAQLFMAFEPTERGFTDGLLHMSEVFDKWASGLDKTKDFQEFLAYLDTSGPEVFHTLESVGNALLQVAEAAAPLGGPTLDAIRAVANAVAVLANSPLGPAVIGITSATMALSRLLAVRKLLMRTDTGSGGGILGTVTSGYKEQLGTITKLPAAYENAAAAQRAVTAAQEEAAVATREYLAVLRVANTGRSMGIEPSEETQARLTDGLGKVQMANYKVQESTEKAAAAEEERGAKLKASAAGAARTAGIVGGLALATSGLADKTGFANTATLALTGSFLGPWGAAAGAGIGLAEDLSHANDDLALSIQRANEAARTGDLATLSTSLASVKSQMDGINTHTGFLDNIGDSLKLAAGQATGKYKFWSTSAELTGDSAASVKADKEKKAQLEAAAAARNAADANQLVAMGYALTAKQASHATEILAANRAEALKTAQSFVGLGSAVDDSKTSLTGWIHQMCAEAQALREFAANSLIAANRGLRQGLIKALQEAGPEGALRMKQLANGTDTQIKRANQAWGSGKRAVKDYTDAIGAAPSGKHLEVTQSGAEQAEAQIKVLRQEIDRLKDKSVHMDEKGSAAARARIAALRAAIAALRDRTVHVNVATRHTGGANSPAASLNAHGSLAYASYAYGDVANRHQPELAGPGPMRIWREPETHGEAYIPLADDDRRPRAKSIAEETVAILGGQVAWFASGDVVDARQSRRRRGDSDATHGVRAGLKALEKSLKDSKTAVDKEKAARDDLVSKRNDLASSISGGLSHDIFGTANVWAAAGGAGGPLGVLKGDIATANTYKSFVASLKKRGLHGAALEDVESNVESSGSLAGIQSIAGMSNANLTQLQKLYDQRTAAVNSAAGFASNAVFGAGIATDGAQLRALNATVTRLEAEVKRHNKGAHARAVATGKAAGEGVGKHIKTAAGQAGRNRSRHS